MNELAFEIGRGLCNLFAALMPVRCYDSSALISVGYIVTLVTAAIVIWLVVARPRIG